MRLYHDARQAEAIACRPDASGGHAPLLSCKWDSNLFLEKWLRYTLGLGHRFGADGTHHPVPVHAGNSLVPS